MEAMTTPNDVRTMARDEDGSFDLGGGHSLAPVLDQQERLVGWLHTHPDARSSSGALCQSFVAAREGFGAEVHEVVIVGPLTLSPDVRCGVCGAHGRVHQGKWEPR